jgi:phospholipid/cholesterol/gamma-HCH transport system substrate-binding protein
VENRAYALLTGLFTVILGVGLCAAIWWMNGDGKHYREYYLETRHSVAGLYPQAAVSLRGMHVGKVVDLRLDPRDPQMILIRIAIESQIALSRGIHAHLGYQGVTGLAYVELEDSGADRTALPPGSVDGPRIAMEASLFEEAAQSGRTLLTGAAQTMERVNALLNSDNQEKLARTLAHLERASAQIEPALRGIPELTSRAKAMLSDENQWKLRRTLNNLEQASGELKPVTEDTRRMIGAVINLSEKLDRLSADVASGVSAQTLPKVNDLMTQLSRDSRDLNRLIALLEKHPQSLVWGKTPPPAGPGERGYKIAR